MKKFTEAYETHLSKIEAAEKVFNNNPNSKTAAVLSELRSTWFNDNEKFTKEFLRAEVDRFKSLVDDLHFGIFLEKNFK